MNLDDLIWSEVEGGYRILYNPSTVLKQLEFAKDAETSANCFHELWEELHHQGDVGLASYFSVPQLIRICIEKHSLDWNYVGLCVVIENCRRRGNNPKLPSDFDRSYLAALSDFADYLLMNFRNIKDHDTSRLALALFAIVSGQADLGKALELLDEGALAELLERY